MRNWRDFLDPTAPPGRYLPWKEVARRTSLSRTTAWRLQRRGDFPLSRAISPGRVGHLENEVDAWVAARAEAGPPAPRPEPGRDLSDGPGTAAPPRPPPAGASPSPRAAPPGKAKPRAREPASGGQQIHFEF